MTLSASLPRRGASKSIGAVLRSGCAVLMLPVPQQDRNSAHRRLTTLTAARLVPPIQVIMRAATTIVAPALVARDNAR